MSTKDDYQQRLQAQLHEWDAKIELMKAKAEKSRAEQKIAYREEIDSLKAKQQDLQDKLEELQAAGEGAWEEIKAGTESAWKELDASFRNAMDRFR